MHRRIPALLAILALLLLILAPVVSGVAADVPAETEAVTTSPTEEIKDRIEALGVTDLTDPIQCATVAIDYITWLVDSLDTDEPYSSHALYMAYNMGLLGSLDAQASGITETRYTREATWYYETYLEIVNSRM